MSTVYEVLDKCPSIDIMDIDDIMLRINPELQQKLRSWKEKIDEKQPIAEPYQSTVSHDESTDTINDDEARTKSIP